MPFHEDECSIPTIWCGKGSAPTGTKNNKKYIAKGEPHECLKQGFGAGMATERSKTIPSYSLMNIPYIGEAYNDALKTEGLRTIDDLLRFIRNNSEDKVESTLKWCFEKSNGQVDYRAYNSTLFYAHNRGITRLPNCKKITGGK